VAVDGATGRELYHRDSAQDSIQALVPIGEDLLVLTQDQVTRVQAATGTMGGAWSIPLATTCELDATRVLVVGFGRLALLLTTGRSTEVTLPTSSDVGLVSGCGRRGDDVILVGTYGRAWEVRPSSGVFVAAWNPTSGELRWRVDLPGALPVSLDTNPIDGDLDTTQWLPLWANRTGDGSDAVLPSFHWIALDGTKRVIGPLLPDAFLPLFETPIGARLLVAVNRGGVLVLDGATGALIDVFRVRADDTRRPASSGAQFTSASKALRERPTREPHEHLVLPNLDRAAPQRCPAVDRAQAGGDARRFLLEPPGGR
jgi:hypothetical protein